MSGSFLYVSIPKEYTACDGTLSALNGAGVMQKGDERWMLLEITSEGVISRAVGAGG